MGGGHGADSPVVKIIQDGDGQRRALGGVCPRSQFVKEAEGVRIRVVQNVYNALHMGGKGGKALFNALLVPDICIYFRKNGKF